MTDAHFVKCVKSYLSLSDTSNHHGCLTVLAAQQFYISRYCTHFSQLQTLLNLPHDCTGSDIVDAVRAIVETPKLAV